MIIADVIFSGIRKSILKYGNVNAKFTIITLTTDASIPYTYPSVNTDIKNTENTMTAGINMSVVNVVFIIRHNPTPMAIITSINSTFFIMSLHLHPLFFLLFCTKLKLSVLYFGKNIYNDVYKKGVRITMIYNLISSDLIKEVTFISVLFAFILTCAAIALGKNILPRDAGRAYAINGSKSVGKPRGAGIIFILTFTLSCVLFIKLDAEIIIYLILTLAAMLSGYLDDSSSSPWGELKKGLIDFVIALMAAFTYLHYNPNTFELAFFSKTVTLHPLIYGFLIVVLIWVSINVTNST